MNNKEIKKKADQLLHILERRRHPTFETLEGLANRLSIPRAEITKNVGTVKMSFLVKHLHELYAAAEYLGVTLEDLMLFSAREFMARLKETSAKKPFEGSELRRKFQEVMHREVQEDLENK